MPAVIGRPLSGCLPISRGSDRSFSARSSSMSPGEVPFGMPARFGFSSSIILLLAELDVGPEAAGLHGDVASSLGILAKHPVGALGIVGGKRTGVAAFR